MTFKLNKFYKYFSSNFFPFLFNEQQYLSHVCAYNKDEDYTLSKQTVTGKRKLHLSLSGGIQP